VSPAETHAYAVACFAKDLAPELEEIQSSLYAVSAGIDHAMFDEEEEEVDASYRATRGHLRAALKKLETLIEAIEPLAKGATPATSAAGNVIDLAARKEARS
jgi:cob(I)alamin adenosyltransferase